MSLVLKSLMFDVFEIIIDFLSAVDSFVILHSRRNYYLNIKKRRGFREVYLLTKRVVGEVVVRSDVLFSSLDKVRYGCYHRFQNQPLGGRTQPSSKPML